MRARPYQQMFGIRVPATPHPMIAEMLFLDGSISRIRTHGLSADLPATPWTDEQHRALTHELHLEGFEQIISLSAVPMPRSIFDEVEDRLRSQWINNPDAPVPFDPHRVTR